MIGGLVACAHSLWRGGRAGDALQRERDAVAAPVRQTLAARRRSAARSAALRSPAPRRGASSAHSRRADVTVAPDRFRTRSADLAHTNLRFSPAAGKRAFAIAAG